MKITLLFRQKLVRLIDRRPTCPACGSHAFVYGELDGFRIWRCENWSCFATRYEEPALFTGTVEWRSHRGSGGFYQSAQQSPMVQSTTLENIIFAALFSLFAVGPATLLGVIVMFLTHNDIIGNAVFLLIFAADIVGMFLWAKHRSASLKRSHL